MKKLLNLMKGMRNSARKKVGISLILGSAAAGLVLQFLGFRLVTLKHSESTGASTVSVVMELQFHWALFLLGLVATAGLLCWILPPHQRQDERETSK